MIAISGCLVGLDCRYDAKCKSDSECLDLIKKGKAIPICPEQLGGLSTPRTPCEIVGGDGHDVLTNKAFVVDKNGIDRTGEFIKGAEAVLYLCNVIGINEVILKEKSPSCGLGKIYNGTFKNVLVDGDGVTTALLKQNSIVVRSK